MEGATVKRIFNLKGEAYFRNLEKRCALWLEQNVDNTIISTGGGFFKQENINKIGKVIYLESSFEAILKRLNSAPNAKAKLKKRPLLQNLEEAKKLYNQRIEEYKKVSDITVNVENKNIKDIVKEILRNC